MSEKVTSASDFSSSASSDKRIPAMLADITNSDDIEWDDNGISDWLAWLVTDEGLNWLRRPENSVVLRLLKEAAADLSNS